MKDKRALCLLKHSYLSYKQDLRRSSKNKCLYQSHLVVMHFITNMIKTKQKLFSVFLNLRNDIILNRIYFFYSDMLMYKCNISSVQETSQWFFFFFFFFFVFRFVFPFFKGGGRSSIVLNDLQYYNLIIYGYSFVQSQTYHLLGITVNI